MHTMISCDELEAQVINYLVRKAERLAEFVEKEVKRQQNQQKLKHYEHP